MALATGDRLDRGEVLASPAPLAALRTVLLTVSVAAVAATRASPAEASPIFYMKIVPRKGEDDEGHER